MTVDTTRVVEHRHVGDQCCRIVHQAPKGDGVEHIRDWHCECSPTIETHEAADGGERLFVVYHHPPAGSAT